MSNDNVSLPPELPATAMERQRAVHAAVLKRQAGQRAADEAEARRRRHSNNDAAIAVQTSFPAKLKEVLNGAVVPEYTGISEALLVDFRKHNSAVGEITLRLDAGVDYLRKALSDATENNQYGDVLYAIEQLKIDKVTLAQQVVSLWSDAEALTNKAVAELAPKIVAAEAESERAVAKVKQELTDIGSGVEATQAFGHNPRAAEHQFHHLATRQNLRARAAIAQAENARAAHVATLARVGICRRGLEVARDYLNEVVRKAINS